MSTFQHRQYHSQVDVVTPKQKKTAADPYWDTEHCSFCGGQLKQDALFPVNGMDVLICMPCIEVLRDERRRAFGDVELRGNVAYLTQRHVQSFHCETCGVETEGRGFFCKKCSDERNSEAVDTR